MWEHQKEGQEGQERVGETRLGWSPKALLRAGLTPWAELRDPDPHGAPLFQEEGNTCFCNHFNYTLQNEQQLPKGINTVGLPIRHESVGEVSYHSL